VALVGADTVWPVALMLIGELAAGGLIDLMITRGAHRRPWIAWLRCLGLGLCGAAAWLAAVGVVALPGLELWASIGAAVVSGVYCAGLFIHHRALYLR
jgi:hypothetical protein